MKFTLATILLLYASLVFSGAPTDIDNPGAHSHGAAYAKTSHTHDSPNGADHVHDNSVSSWYAGAGIGLAQYDVCEPDAQAYIYPLAQASTYTDKPTPTPTIYNSPTCTNQDQDELSMKI